MLEEYCQTINLKQLTLGSPLVINSVSANTDTGFVNKFNCLGHLGGAV